MILILVFLGIYDSVLDLGPMYATDRRCCCCTDDAHLTDVRCASSLNTPNFSFPRLLCSRPDVLDRQRDRRQSTSDTHRSLMPHTLGAGAE